MRATPLDLATELSNYYKAKPVLELAGFEPVTPSLRKMRSNLLTRGFRVNTRSCGAGVGRTT
jgi:hypothetical protein